jgi:hypothetical protein
MSLPARLKSKYLLRFDELIAEGENIHKDIRPEHTYSGKSFIDYSDIITTTHPVDWQRYIEWRTKVSSLLCNIVSKDNVHYQTIIGFSKINNTKEHLEYGLSLLKGIKEDFKNGMLESIASQWEAANLAEYMTQAEQLLGEGISGKFDHIPAAVLAGAVLEKALRGLCQKCNPPIPILNNANEPLQLNGLIDALKKADIFNELTAKQLRAWADIRNKAAHGEFDKFKKNDVDLMLKGVGSFLANYLH